MGHSTRNFSNEIKCFCTKRKLGRKEHYGIKNYASPSSKKGCRRRQRPGPPLLCLSRMLMIAVLSFGRYDQNMGSRYSWGSPTAVTAFLSPLGPFRNADNLYYIQKESRIRLVNLRMTENDIDLPTNKAEQSFSQDAKETMSGSTHSLNQRLLSLVTTKQKENFPIYPRERAKQASKLLASIESQYDAHPQVEEKPTNDIYVATLKLWAISGTADGPQRAEQILKRMQRLQNSPGYRHIQPNAECYRVVIKAHATNPASAHRAEHWLNKLEQEWENRDSETDDSLDEYISIWPNGIMLICYNMCIDAWARSSGPSKKGIHSSNRAQGLLQQLKNHRDDLLSPDTFSYASVLKSMASVGGQKGAKLAKILLTEMEALYSDDPLGPVQPNVVAYSAVIHALANSGGGEHAALECEELLTQMVNLHSKGQNLNVKPNAYSYEGVISAWAKSGTGVKGAMRAEAILNHMQKLYRTGNHSVKPLTICVNAVMDAWSMSEGGVAAAEHTESILHSMLHSSEVNQTQLEVFKGIRPNTESVNAAITAWAYSNDPKAAEKAERMLAVFSELKQRTDSVSSIRPNAQSYNIVISAYGKSHIEDAPRKAESILYQLINDQKGTSVRPNSRSFGIVINIWARSKERGSAERAEQLLGQMEKLYSEGNWEAEPTVVVYSTVIDAWAKSNLPDGGLKAQRIFDRMIRQAKVANKKNLHPNTITFNTLLRAWSNSNSPKKAADQAISLLAQMNKLYESGFRDAKPNSRTLNTVMLCMAKNSKGDPTSAERAETLLNEMLEMFLAGDRTMMPDSFTFSTAINAWVWSTSKDAAKGVLRVVRQMESLYDDRIVHSQPHAISYNSVIRFFVDRNDPVQADEVLAMMETTFQKGVPDAKPDTRTYFAILNSYAKTPNEGASSHKVLGVLARMESMYQKGNIAAKPNTRCYNMVLAALARSSEKGASQSALELFAKMKDLWAAGNGDADTKPDTVSYSTVINALARSGGGNDAAHKALDLLTEMEELRKSGDLDVVPNLISFNAVLNALSKAKHTEAAEKAEELLERMEEMQHMRNPLYNDVRPNNISYTSVINAWSLTRVKGAGAKAEAVLRRMEALCDAGNIAVCPDTITFNTVIIAWVNSREEESAPRADAILKYMESLYEQGNTRAKPDALTYKTIIVAWAHCSEEGAVERAHELLSFMEKKYLEGEKDMKPDLQHYKILAHAWKSKGEAGEKYTMELSKRATKVGRIK